MQGGDEPFFASDQNYQRVDLSPGEYGYSWEEFSRRIKHERRFFDEQARSHLSLILGSAGSERFAELPILEIGPGKSVELVFRARRAESLA